MVLSGSWVRRAAVAVVVRPRLWRTALRQLLGLARPGWWHRWPPFPSPDAAYLSFRLVTQYGAADHAPEPDDVVSYLEWCREARDFLR